MKFSWEPNQNGKDRYETLYVENEQGRRIAMAQIYPSQSGNPEMGYTMVKRDMNYALGDKFISHNDKAWNLTLDAARGKAEFAAQQHFDNAQQFTAGQAFSHEQPGKAAEPSAQETPEPQVELER